MIEERDCELAREVGLCGLYLFDKQYEECNMRVRVIYFDNDYYLHVMKYGEVIDFYKIDWS